ncbi:hypothetical protein R1flu_001604 [Riccia fluitans]|uniref:F-box domain-containing protein n=1 Tax=Riccia fluitans TaxID=41844 RepID=A0ABD1Y4S0_9MARC
MDDTADKSREFELDKSQLTSIVYHSRLSRASRLNSRNCWRRVDHDSNYTSAEEIVHQEVGWVRDKRVNMKEIEPRTSAGDLPDDILQICFARLPLRHLSRVRVVCKRWLKLGDAQLLRSLRKSLGLTQTCTFILENEYNSFGSYRGLQGRAVDPQSQKVHPIATLDVPQRLQFGATGADGLVYILGGRSPLVCRTPCKAWVVYSRVDVYEPFSNCWYQLQPMRRARFGFAAGAFVDPGTRTSKLIVAGGYDGEGEALSVAEVFDFCKGVWIPIPSMRSLCGPCRGEVFEGRFYVQQANSGPGEESTSNLAECNFFQHIHRSTADPGMNWLVLEENEGYARDSISVNSCHTLPFTYLLGKQAKRQCMYSLGELCMFV